jgi:NAD(P)-dependent dehydrogenase (short-subunit alcohol dehydrogenase family)/acyl carrier protein
VTPIQQLAPAPPAPVAPQPAAPSTPATATPPNGDRVGDVMARYQQVMQRFLDAQTSVMLAYLGAPRAPARAPAPAPALPPPAPVVAAPPAVAAEAAVAGPAPVPAATPPAPTGNGHALLTPDEIEQRLLVVVSERTGYPAEMLDLDADLEGDLGIDSIKRVEIAGTLTQTVALPEGAAVDVEELTASRTLRQVVASLAKAFGPPDALPPGDGHTSTAPEDVRPFEDGPADEERIGRFVLQAASAPAITATARLAGDGVVVIVDDETGVGQALADALTQRGEQVLRLGRKQVPQSAEAATELAERLLAEHAGAKALVHLAALGDADDAGIAVLLDLARALRADLEAAAAAGGAAVLGASRLGGAFGVEGAVPEGAAAHGAISGFLKTLAQEWPAVRVKAVDLSVLDPRLAADQLLAELDAADDLLEVGYRDGQRTRLTLAPVPLDGRGDAAPIDGDSVVLVTGGARGITADAAIALAERYAPTLVLVGRTRPGEEDPATAGLSDPRDLRRALIEERRRAGAEATPALVEEDCRRILREREVRDTLARLGETRARVEHLSCDVCDAEAFAALIDGIYERHGRIDGVIHGAGVIEDRLVRDKERASLERVMATKAGSARTLVERLRPESLRFFVLFSSVSGRFGNRGQADYAAASEVINKLAQELDRRWAARVAAINWGPWERAGMVSPEVAREFARRGVGLIPVAVGCRLLDDELRRGRKGEVEIVVGAAAAAAPEDAATPPLLAGAPLRRTEDGGLEAERMLRLEHDRYLDDHRVDGLAVLPFAVAMELMAEAAVAANPGLEIAGLRDIRVLHGVTVDDEDGTPVRVRAAPRGPSVEATIVGAEEPRRHYRALVDLREAGVDESNDDGSPAPLPELAPFPMSIADAYRDLLFHGPRFQAIVAIEGMDDRGARALLRPSEPGACLADAADGAAWLLDPVLIDGALQVQVLWARLQWGVTLLPAEIGSYGRTAVPAGELVRLELRIRRGSQPPLCHADHWFYDPADRLTATLGDVVGVGTQALNRLAGARS